MSIAGYHVIDCHHHVGSLEAQGFDFGGRDAGRDPAEVDLERRLSGMDRLGVDQAILIPGHGYLRPNGMADTQRINDMVATYRDRTPDRFPAALGIAEPIYGPAGLAELSRMKNELGMVGVSVHTRFQGVQTDSPLVMAMVKEAAKIGLIPFVHAVEGVPDEALWRAQQVARAIPDTTVVILDAFGGSEHARQAVIIAKETPNLVWDTSLAHHWLFVEAMINAVGPERVIFGTDYYSMMPDPQHSVVLDHLSEGALPTDATAAILSGNLKRVLGLR